MNKRAIMVLLVVVWLGLIPVASSAVIAQETRLLIWVGDEQAFDPAIYEEFEEKTGIGVDVEAIPSNEVPAVFSEAALGGRGPDVVFVSDEWMTGFLEEGLVAPVAMNTALDEMIPYAIQAYTHHGELYAVPVALTNLAFIRNTDLVPELPQTWDEVTGISREIRSSGTVEYGFVLPDWDGYHFLPIMSAFGGYLLGRHDDGSWNPNDIGLDNDGSIAAASWLHEVTENDIVPAGLDWAGVHEAFYTGRAAMIISGPWIIGQLEESGVPYAVSAFPAQAQPARPFVHVHGFMANARSNDLDAAQAFLQHVASARSIALLYTGYGALPTHVEVLEQIEDPVLLGFLASALNGQQYPDTVIMDAIWNPWIDAIQQARVGELEPAEAMHAAVARIRANLGLE